VRFARLRPRPLPDLPAARLGLALLALTAAAWVTGLPYLLVRFGFPFPIPLARIDGPHIFVGASLAGILLAKVGQLHLRQGLRKLSGVLRWQRWLSLGLLATYGGIVLSGLLLLLPFPATVQRQLVNLHLLTAAWAGVMTAVHAGRYLLRRLPPATADLRFALGVGLILLPAVGLLALPAAAAPLTRLGSGGAWQPVGPHGSFTSKVVRLPGGVLVALGTGMWTSPDEGATWSAVPAVAGRLVRALATGPGGAPVYLGTDQGVLIADRLPGPYRATSMTGLIQTVLVAPDDPTQVWAGGAGLWASHDAGATWGPAAAGLVPRGWIWTIGAFDKTLYAGGTTGIYRWSGAAWQQVSTMGSVYSLDPGPNGEIWASSMGQGLAVLRAGRWQSSAAGLDGHEHAAGGAHVDGFTTLGGGRAVEATMDAGVSESIDGGATWSQLTPGWHPGDVWQVVATTGGLLAATDTGLYLYRFAAAPATSPAWWVLLLGGALLSSLAGSVLGLAAARDRARLPRSSPAALEPVAGGG
jgi:hypothetical protein